MRRRLGQIPRVLGKAIQCVLHWRPSTTAALILAFMATLFVIAWALTTFRVPQTVVTLGWPDQLPHSWQAWTSGDGRLSLDALGSLR